MSLVPAGDFGSVRAVRGNRMTLVHISHWESVATFYFWRQKLHWPKNILNLILGYAENYPLGFDSEGAAINWYGLTRCACDLSPDFRIYQLANRPFSLLYFALFNSFKQSCYKGHFVEILPPPSSVIRYCVEFPSWSHSTLPIFWFLETVCRGKLPFGLTVL